MHARARACVCVCGVCVCVCVTICTVSGLKSSGSCTFCVHARACVCVVCVCVCVRVCVKIAFIAATRKIGVVERMRANG